MDRSERFATEGLIFPAFMIAFGSLMTLREPSNPIATSEQVAPDPDPARSLAERDDARLRWRAGWVVIGAALVIALLRLSQS